MYRELIEQVIESALDKDYVSFNEVVEEVIEEKMRETLAENITDIQENLFYDMDESYDTDVLTRPEEDDDDKHEFNRDSQDQPDAGGQPDIPKGTIRKLKRKNASYTDDSEDNRPGGKQPHIPTSWNHEKIDSDKKALGKKKISEARSDRASNHRNPFVPTHDNDYTGYESEYDHERDPETDAEKVAFNKASETGPNRGKHGVATNLGRFESYEDRVAEKLAVLKEERDFQIRISEDDEVIEVGETIIKEKMEKKVRSRKLSEMKKAMKDDDEYEELKGDGKQSVKDAESKEDDEYAEERGVEQAVEKKKKKGDE